jgi:hypothetical protein
LITTSGVGCPSDEVRCRYLSGKYSKLCAVPNSILLKEQCMWTNFISENTKKEKSDAVLRAKTFGSGGFGNFGTGDVGRAYAQVINHASANEFRPFFNDYISTDAHVITDIWKGCLSLKKKYPSLEQIPSDKGANFPELHIHIMNIQGWLRGIHHHCSKEYLQACIDEYH